MPTSFKGQRVLVIGAAGGIGHATATVFAQAGALLTAAGRPGPELDAAARELGAEPAALDILDADGAEAFFVGDRRRLLDQDRFGR
jgi:NAD(P)-dependent dehydrogenase (short-subunit alcohol dehydrogenase family)